MTTMIDRVARAMFDATNEHDETWDTEAQEIKTTYLIMARAAIEAMRSAPELLAADLRLDGQHIASYHDIIDAALNEQVSG